MACVSGFRRATTTAGVWIMRGQGGTRERLLAVQKSGKAHAKPLMPNCLEETGSSG